MPSAVHLVTTEARDALGRIVVNPLAAFLEEDDAETFAARHNETPKTEPKTAEVVSVPLFRHADAEMPPARAGQKLDSYEVRQIRARAAAGESTRDLAAAYSVSPPTINDLIRGTTYKWVA